MDTVHSLVFDVHTDTRRLARTLYWQSWSVTAIAAELNEKYQTVASWKRRDAWDDSTHLQRVESCNEARLCALIAKPVKSNGDYKEIDALTRVMERTAKIGKFLNGGNLRHIDEGVDKRVRATADTKAWQITDEMVAKLREAALADLAKYQTRWWNARHHRYRLLIKSRQIGATWYFAREAIIEAFATGKNQIFLSASKAQAHIFKRYIVAFVKEVLGIELKGDPIVLPNEATLFFLGTNWRTAQGYNGDVYMDEFFWIPNFEQFRKLAGAMASHKQFKSTFFSTPSFLQHEAYPFWINDKWAKRNKSEIVTTHDALKGGAVGLDGRWREICNIEDAQADGCTLFDFEELRNEWSEDEFENLFMCEFMDDSQSEFPVSGLLSCLVDSWEDWTDFAPFDSRPFGHKPVAIGYDPALSGDNAGVVVLAMPCVDYPYFRLLHKDKWHGTFSVQAERMKELYRRYNVVHIGVDQSGIGATVLPLIRGFYPTATGYTYSPEVKFRMVMKAKDVISKGRLKFDHRDKEMVGAFNSVRRRLTESGHKVTFDSARKGNDHGDLAWAAMHAMMAESMDVGGNRVGSHMEML